MIQFTFKNTLWVGDLLCFLVTTPLDLSKELNIKNYEDWYQLSWDTLRHYGGSFISKKPWGKSIISILRTAFPQYAWDEKKLPKVSTGYWEYLLHHGRLYWRFYRHTVAGSFVAYKEVSKKTKGLV
jgi:hypothetical protein